MSGIDVRDLAKESLTEGRFPATPRADFRLHLAPEVHRGTWDHARQDTSVEICGVLVGRWERDEHGPYAVVTDYIRCEQASSKFAEVTFTHESWAQINREMDTKFADARIIGWYHSHPDFGIFLSDRDCFIQQHFFSSPGQIAYVIDPVRELEGVFAWRAGKPEPLPHYWVGDRIHAADSVQQRRTSRAHDPSDRGVLPDGTADAMPMSARSTYLNMATTVFGLLAVFLFGYLYSGWQAGWERQRLLERYATLLKSGMESRLDAVQGRLLAVTREFRKLPDLTPESSPEDVQSAAKQRKLVDDNLVRCADELVAIRLDYVPSAEDRLALLRLAGLDLEELDKRVNAALESAAKSRAAAETPENTDQKTTPAPASGEPAKP